MTATSRQPFGGASLRSIAEEPVQTTTSFADRALVPQRLDRGLPSGHGGDLVEQQQAGNLAAGEIERPLHGCGQLG